MGRLIDADKAIKDMQYYHDDCAQTSEYTKLGFETAMEVVKSAPTVEAIPKGQYEARLKADMVAILDKIRAEIKALSPKPTAYDVVDGNPVKDAIWETLIEVDKIIDKYKGESEPQESEG